MTQPAAAARVPADVWLRVLALLAPRDIVAARGTCRALWDAGTCAALWRAVRVQMGVAFPAAPRAPRAVALAWPAVVAQRREDAWRVPGARPFRVFRIRAHVSRITSLKLVVGSTGRWLVTGSVDGYVRVWDLGAVAPLDVSGEFGCAAAGGAGADPAHEVRRHARVALVAEVDTGGDVTATDAALDGRTLTIAVGSYYSDAACLVYALDMDTRVLALRAALDVPVWCGTQCVSLCGDCVAVGTHMDGTHVLNWRTGWHGAVQRTDRVSTAAVRLTRTHVVVATRLGALRIFAWPVGDAAGRLLRHVELTGGRPVVSVAVGEGQAGGAPGEAPGEALPSPSAPSPSPGSSFFTFSSPSSSSSSSRSMLPGM